MTARFFLEQRKKLYSPSDLKAPVGEEQLLQVPRVSRIHICLRRSMVELMLVIIRGREAMLATNRGLTKLILYQYVVRTAKDLTNHIKLWISII